MIRFTQHKWKSYFRFLIRRSSQFLVFFCPIASWRKHIRNAADKQIVRIFRPEVETFMEAYPKVILENETLKYLTEEKLSITRFGDGEFRVMMGERQKSFQDIDPRLSKRMKEVLESKDPRVVVAIFPARSFEELSLIWQKFIIRFNNRILQLFESDRTYADACVFRNVGAPTAKEFLRKVRAIKKIWEDRDVVFVVGNNSRFKFEDELFNNCRSVSYIYGPPKNAFSEYDSLIGQVRKYDKEKYLILIVLGPTATVMAYDLALENYQAIDFGQMPGQFRGARRQFFKDHEPSGLE